MLSTPEFWVLISFILFLALLGYMGVHNKAIAALDSRSSRIRQDLAEAQRLREEAQLMLASAQQRQREAEQEATEIIALAREDARALAGETRRKLAELLDRRRKLADLKIQQAEEQAVKDVRAVAADLAISAAAKIMAETMRGPNGSKLVEDSIAALNNRIQ
ncbi:F-type H+-transporting ATPase subunit b [Rhodoligotrophos appendicifer]|uniref:F0F1 ATP synthase subunit B family protein n=1 Tax=Rhodoligotrophos appendicifer TaxID=987056 RepID=UPI0011855536|nr:ATP F0F1 synthase subunit B [Rhodoligotrophos appendicifer]